MDGSIDRSTNRPIDTSPRPIRYESTPPPQAHSFILSFTHTRTMQSSVTYLCHVQLPRLALRRRNGRRTDALLLLLPLAPHGSAGVDGLMD